MALRVRETAVAGHKRSANLSVNAELLDDAKALDINLSATLEKALDEAVRARRREQWLEENREAIAAYNARIERDGMAGDHVRAFKARTGA
ncbi:type II toxin-antitoxin system CcdA family antitoxin [Solilutibacter silvestris]|uniref:Post-segregation antitoxin n=1 Tax=Solilutibacter silvestris TaxID=1645665 RepID=A0A2K1Q2P3_9GAMM|nr:type II toxin-antitoxin system CcdA family antitoxin [Lysobacter silvestris]PNS09320.1 Post-segregation antitoxin [Lysobacter silvestris]